MARRDRDWAWRGRRPWGRRTLLAVTATLLGVLTAGSATGSAQPLQRDATKPPGHGRVVPIGGPATASHPGRFTIRGQTAAVGTARVTGAVLLRGRWGNGPWRILDRTRTDARGAYTAVAILDRRGTLHLRLETPDGYVAVKALEVT